jgi:hypothetical protein
MGSLSKQYIMVKKRSSSCAKLIKLCAMKATGELVHRSTYSDYSKVSGHLHISAAIPTGKELPIPIQYEAGWASIGLDTMEKGNVLLLAGLEILLLRHPSRSQSLLYPVYKR